MCPWKYTWVLVLLCCIGLSPRAYGQTKTYILHCILQDGEDWAFARKISYPKVHADSLLASEALRKYVQELQYAAFWLADVEHTSFRNDSLIAHIQLGKRFRWEALAPGNLEPSLWADVGYKAKYFQGTPFLFREWEALKDRILTYAENHGLPFASVKLDSIQIREDRVRAVIQYAPGVGMRFDTLIVEGSARIRKQFLSRLLNIRSGSTYDQQKVKRIRRILGQLPYLQQKDEPTVVFNRELAYVTLQLDRKKSNQIDGILGVFPNETDGGTLITGELNLDLKNLFTSGKNLRVQWQRLQSQSQLLDIEYLHPVILGSNLDFSFDFYLLRQDSSFLNRRVGASIFYNLFDSGKFRVTINSRRSTLGSENLFREFSSLPNVSEVSFLSYGLGYTLNKLDDIFYPKKGLYVDLSMNIGTKNIVQNPFVPDSLYRGIPLRSTQVILRTSLENYFPIARRFVFLTRMNAGRLFNKNLFLNELFRLGGLKTLRGHNENSFFASTYVVSTLEARWFFDRESYFFLFYDQGFLQQDILGAFSNDFPLGTGLGVSFSVKTGIFNLVYALGRSNTQEFGFGRSKVHFGLISRF